MDLGLPLLMLPTNPYQGLITGFSPTLHNNLIFLFYSLAKLSTVPGLGTRYYQVLYSSGLVYPWVPPKSTDKYGAHYYLIRYSGPGIDSDANNVKTCNVRDNGCTHRHSAITMQYGLGHICPLLSLPAHKGSPIVA